MKMKRNRLFKIIMLSVAGIMAMLFLLEGLMQMKNARDKAIEIAKNELNYVENILDMSIEQNAQIGDEVKGEYLIRTRAIAYVLQNNPEIENDLKELMILASILKVDEIHLFDGSGVIVGGTRPEYYGLKFSDGEQIGYFEPMLNDKSLELYQDVTPNTADGTPMMYAMVWKNDGSGMVQIGMKPKNLVEQIKNNSIEKIITGIMNSSDMNIYMADRNTFKILSSNWKNYNGETLEDIGIDVSKIENGETYVDTIKVEGQKSYVAMRSYKDYIIGVVRSRESVNSALKINLIKVLVSLIIATVIILVTAKIITDKLRMSEIKYHHAEAKSKIGACESEINNIMRKAIDYSSPKDSIKELLKAVGGILKSDRAFIGLFEDCGVHADSVSWIIKDGMDVFGKTEIRDEAMNIWEKRFKEGEKIMFYTDKEVLEKYGDSRDYEYLQKIGVRNTIMMPLQTQGQLIGIMGIGNVDTDIAKDYLDILPQISSFAISILRQENAYNKLSSLSYNDGLTGALNRHALDERADALLKGGRVAIIFGDVMGLKQINDTAGHNAGDKLLVKAYKTCISLFGRDNVYRIGGDEYVILLENMEEGNVKSLMNNLADKLYLNSSEMALGYAYTENYNGNFKTLQRIADDNMYADKEARYARRESQGRREHSREKNTVLNDLQQLYMKVMSVNLTDDTYIVVKTYEEETKQSGSEHFSELRLYYANKGDIHKEDVEEFLNKTEPSYIREFFNNGNRVLKITYRKFVGAGFRRVVMEMVPESDYGENNEKLLMCVRLDD